MGWLIDTTAKTIAPLPHRIDHLREILESIVPDQRMIVTKDWHKVLGELHSTGLVGLFSLLQEVFRHEDPTRPRLNLSKPLYGFLKDSCWLVKDVATLLRRIAELIPDPVPATIGACDTAGPGMGGIHFVPSPDGSITPLQRFPPWIQCQLVSISNPDGTINNSDLELAGFVSHNDILAMAAEVDERTTHNFYDNTATVFWQQKGSATTTGPPAYLLHLQELHQ